MSFICFAGMWNLFLPKKNDDNIHSGLSFDVTGLICFLVCVWKISCKTFLPSSHQKFLPPSNICWSWFGNGIAALGTRFLFQKHSSLFAAVTYFYLPFAISYGAAISLYCSTGPDPWRKFQHKIWLYAGIGQSEKLKLVAWLIWLVNYSIE